MSETANWTPNWRALASAANTHPTDSLPLRLRWRLLIQPARPRLDAATLRINRAAPAAENRPPLHRWRPMTPPSQPVPPWRWPGRTRSERASRRPTISERWRHITIR